MWIYIFLESNCHRFLVIVTLSPIIPREEDMPTIFARERRKVESGEKKPRYRVVAVHDLNLKIYVDHIRKKELDQLAEATGANLVLLEGGKQEKEKTKPSE